MEHPKDPRPITNMIVSVLKRVISVRTSLTFRNLQNTSLWCLHKMRSQIRRMGAIFQTQT